MKPLFEGFKAGHKRLVCIDSDGCAFDTMELKHKECFCPATIKVWGLQPISKYAREAWEFGNLYSLDRGRSRFHELLLMFELLADREEVRQYDVQFPDLAPLRHWIEHTPVLNHRELQKHRDEPILARVLEWSLECNRLIEEMVRGVPPFPGVTECLSRLSKDADIAIVSATAREALEREWTEHHLMQYVNQLCAQEDGSKKDCIAAMKAYYPQDSILMIGDAPGDLEAARTNGIRFYPIRPGEEIASWRVFADEGMSCFLNGTYDDTYEQQQLELFRRSLAEIPPWPRISESGNPERK